MKRLMLAAALAGLMFVPAAATADDVADGADCRSGSAAPVAAGAAGGEDADRGSVCVHANGTTVFYIGGEAQAEEEQGTGGACGAIIVMNATITGSDNWDDASNGRHCD